VASAELRGEDRKHRSSIARAVVSSEAIPPSSRCAVKTVARSASQGPTPAAGSICRPKACADQTARMKSERTQPLVRSLDSFGNEQTIPLLLTGVDALDALGIGLLVCNCSVSENACASPERVGLFVAEEHRARPLGRSKDGTAGICAAERSSEGRQPGAHRPLLRG